MEHFHETGERRRVRSLFISDVHLGSRFAQAEAFLAFLETYQPEFLYIVGDFVDGWSLRRSWHWNRTYTQILHHLFDWASSGVTIRYTPGNHDEFLREFLKDFLLVEIADEFVHESADRRRYLVMHGDQFDNVERRAAWLSKLGSVGYEVLLWTDRFVNRVRRALGLRGWRLSAGVKAHIKHVVSFLSGFEQRLTEHAQRHGCDGVVCGHIHTPALAQRGELTYCNTGDWVENCSALLEFDDGELRLVRFCPGTGTIAHHESRVPSPAPVVAGVRTDSTPPAVELPT